MSILHSLLRWVDIIEYRQKQSGDRETRRSGRPAFPTTTTSSCRRSGRPRRTAPLVCRICGYSGGPEHRFCPRCLAETMERRR